MKKFTKFWQLLLLFAFVPVVINAQVQIGAGLNTNQHLPIEPFYGYSYSQTLYFASDFGTPGADKQIEKIWYNYTWLGGDEDSDTWVIYMSTTSATNLDAGYLDISGFTQVFSGDVDLELVSGTGWIEIVLDIPFPYNPATDGNLVVAVDENEPSYTSSSDEFYCDLNGSATNVSIWYYSDGTNPDPSSPPAGTLSTYYPNTQFLFGDVPSCPQPIGLNVSNITSSSVDLGWTETGAATTWEYAIDVSPYGPPVGAGTSTTDNPVSVGSLLPATTYDWYVRADCGSEYSLWSGPFSFITACEPYSAPFSENFDGVTAPELPVCWSNYVNSTSTFAAAAPYLSTSAPSQPNYFRFYNSADAAAELVMISPQLSATKGLLADKRIKFQAYASDLTNSYQLQVGTMSDPLDFGTFELYTTIDLTSSFQEYTVNFDGYAGDDDYIAITPIFGGTYDYVYLDDFVYEEIPSCLEPSGLFADNISSSSVFLNWTDNNTPASASFNIEYGITGFTPTGTPTTTSTTSPKEITGLMAGTTYDFYVQANCGSSTSAWTGPETFTTAYAAPYCEDFTGGYPAENWTEGTGAPPAVPTFGSSLWLEDGFANNGTTGSARVEVYSTTRDEWFFTPITDLGSGTFNLEFDLALTDYANSNPPESVGDDDKFAVYISDDDFATYTLLQMWDNLTTPAFGDISTTGEKITISLSGYSDEVKIGFYAESTVSNADNDLFVDNICFVDPTVVPECSNAVNPPDAATDVTTPGNLVWTSAAGATGYLLYFGTDGGGTVDPTNIENGTDLGNVTSYGYSGLALSTTYYWKIVPYNGNGNAVGCDIWSFTTEVPVSTPASEDFETFVSGTNATGYANGWSTEPTGTTSLFRWNVDAGGTPSSATGPAVDHTTGAAAGIYLFTESTSGSALDEAYVYSPWYDLSGLTDPAMEFWYHMYGATMGELHVDIDAGSGWVNDISTAIIGQQQTSDTDPWMSQLVDLTGYSGQTVKFRFRGIRGSSYTSDMAIDDFSLLELPDCLPPDNVNVDAILSDQADLSWEPQNSEGTWYIEVGVPGFTPGTTSALHYYTYNPGGEPTPTVTYTMTGLTAQTDYEVYVQADCNADATSTWAGPVAFATACASVTAPGWSEDFENAGSIPDCWTQGASNLENWIFATTGGHVGNAGTIGGTTASGSYFAYVDDSTPDNLGTTLESPFVDVTALTTPMLQFYLISNNEGNSNVDFSVDVWDGAAWNTVFTSNSNTLNGEWELKSVVLNSLTITGDIQIRFIVDEIVTSDFYDDVAIDDVTVIEAPLPGTLEGYVYDLEGNPLENATVTVLQTSNSAVTNASGFYTMSEFPGSYNVVASKPDYVSQTVSGVVILESSTTIQNFNLPYGNTPSNFMVTATDAQIDLSWQAPVDVSATEIAYDDGVQETWYWVGAPSTTDQLFYVNFTAVENGNLSHVSLFARNDGGGIGWESVMVCPDDGFGEPDLLSPIEDFGQVEVSSPTGEWIILQLSTPHALTAGDEFFVVTKWPNGSQNGPFVGADESSPDSRSYWTSAGGTTWNQFTTHDWIMRAYYTTAKSSNIVLTVDQSTKVEEIILPTSSLIDENEKLFKPVTALEYGLNSIALSMDIPAIISGPLSGKALTGYKVYKGTDPGALSFLADVAGLSYTDAPLTNNMLYFYGVRAVYDEGLSEMTTIKPGVPQEALSAPFTQNFDLTDGGFAASGDWEWGIPTSGPAAAFSDPNVWATVLAGDYSSPSISGLFNTFDLSSGGDYTVSFMRWFDVEATFDFVYFGVDPENDGVYTILKVYDGTEDAWTKDYIQIPASLTSAYTRVAFLLISDASTAFAGFYLDDFEIQPYNPAVISTGPASFAETVVTNGNAFNSMNVGNTGDFPLTYSASIEYLGVNNVLNETFDTEIPATWSQVIYSGTGVWSWTNTTTTFLGSDGSFVQANDDETGADYDVGLFTPSLDLTGESNVILEFDRNFQDFANYGEATVSVYSGGTGLANFEEELLFLTADDPGGTGTAGGVHTVLTFDPSIYADPANVYIEFYYTDEAYAGAWFFKLDNVEVYAGVTGYLSLDGGTDVSGSVNPGEAATEILVGFDAVGIPADVYNANINIASNDPVNPNVSIPVTMTVVAGIATELTVLLEGPYDAAGVMLQDLNTGGYIPLGQPYNPALPYYGNAAPKWLYAGSESVGAVPADVVDWVMVQVRDAVDAVSATSATIEAEQAAFVKTDGSIVGLDGMSRLGFPGVTIDNDLFMVVYHRNHLGIMSGNAVTNVGGFYDYDFSTGETQVYGGTNGHKELEVGFWGMVAADGDGNGLVQNTDETGPWKTDLGSSGYLGGDFDMNGLGQNTDETDLWKPNLGGGGQVPAKSSDTGYQSQIPK